jgi:PEP-CTERM motif
MNRFTPRSIALAVIACSLSLPALAVPVRAQFSGAVTDYTAFFSNVASEFPLGSAASFDVTFDDANLGPSAPSQYDLAPVSGTVRLGGLEWLLDAGRIWSYTYQNQPGFPVDHYGLQLTGSGPSINSNGSLFGLFLRIAPNLDPAAIDPFMIGFRFPFAGGGGESYGYAKVTGTSNITRGGVSVPEPSTLLLITLGFVLLGFNSRNARTFVRGLNARS